MKNHLPGYLISRILIIASIAISENSYGQIGFPATAENWNIPFLDYYAERSYGYWGEHALIDMNGDDIPDLIDLEDDNNSNTTWLNGPQQYWKVFPGTGNGFSATASNWNIPFLDYHAERSFGEYGEHLIIDINGDNKADLIDLADDNNSGLTWLNGPQKYWKVYLGDGNSFSSTASNWNIPYLDVYAARSNGEYGEHTLIDMNGDDKPDLVDLEDDNNNDYTWLNGPQKYWKVYINTGSGFSSSASDWNIPFLDASAQRLYAQYGEHLLIDINGDKKPDLIDLEDDTNHDYTWLNGPQKYWKVYINSGSGFSSSASDWNIPYLDPSAQRANGYQGEHVLFDMNGDDKPDLIDLEDDSNNDETWLDGLQKYWKVFMNSGSGFATNATDWNIPFLDYHAASSYGNKSQHLLMDMTGDNYTDLVDLEDDNSYNNTWLDASQKYWKVFVNSTSGVESFSSSPSFSVYPNPSSGNFILELPGSFIADEISIDVVNTLGQKIFSSTDSRSEATPSFKKEIDLSNVASGIYFIEIKKANLFLRKKILIAD